MNRSATLLLAVLSISGLLGLAAPRALSGGSIDPPFMVKIDSSRPEAFLPAIVMLADQTDLEALDTRMVAEHAGRQVRHERVVNELKRVALGTQIQISEVLRLGVDNGDVESYRSFWVANLFTVRAKPGFLRALSERFDVGVIYDDAPVYLVESIGQGGNESPASAEWNLRMIYADSLWASGATGGGRLVCNLDTGVDGSHPALTDRWRGNDPGVTPQEAWFDPYNHSTFPVDNGGHGTHTMGTITGADHTSGDTVGVAFGAKWIAANIFEDPQTTSSAFMAAFQWTIDPDGDPSTIDDVPDVVSNSWGSSDPACFNQYWRVIDANEAAGVAIVFSAGNSGPGPYTIGSPASRQATPYNVVSVGAVNQSAVIASFSSRGPSLCDSVSIKPEVVAPGVSIRSSTPGGNYSFMQGTSMACPHVAGAVALLRQVSPNATVEEVFDALFMTAEDLGAVGEDNNYGMGLINLAEAARYLLPISNDPYLVYSGSTVDDGNNGEPEPGETFDLICHLGNMGANTTGVSATLHTVDPFIQIVSGSSDFGAINSQSVGDNSSNPFVVTLDDATPGSHFLDFVLDVEADGGAYTTQLEFSLLTPFELELMDHDVGNVVFSVSDGGRFGFDNLDLTAGSGFIFPKGGNNWMFEGALLVGTDTLHVSHSARGTPAGPVETDWQVSPGGNIVISEPGVIADEEGHSVYTDIGAPNPLDLGIVQRSYAYSDSPDDDYIIVQFDMTSLSPDSGTVVENLYVGLFFDWDVSVSGNEYLTNDGAMSREYDVGYMYRSLSPSYPYVGVSVLSDMGMTAFHLINNQNSEYNFTRAEYFESMSGGFVDTLRTMGDYSFVIATGPFSLPAGNTLTTAFAILAGEGLVDLATNINAARARWTEIHPVGIEDPVSGGSGPLPKSYALSQNYPNPFNPATSITFSIAAESGKTEPVPTRLRVFNMRGQLVKTLVDRDMVPGNHKVSWNGRDEQGLEVSSGVYIYTLEAGAYRTQRKMVLLK